MTNSNTGGKTPEEMRTEIMQEYFVGYEIPEDLYRQIKLSLKGYAEKIEEQSQPPIPSDIIAFRDAEAEKRWPFYTDEEMLKYNSEIEEERERFKKAFDLCHSTYVVPLEEELKKETECVQFMKDVSDDQVKRIAELEAENKELKKANL